MCGILCVFGSHEDENHLVKLLSKLSLKQKHRGPDARGIFSRSYFENEMIFTDVIVHERLIINDFKNGTQPFIDKKSLAAAVNGEIYNHRELRKLLNNIKFNSYCDCEPVIYLYKTFGINFVDKLDGIFSLVISAVGYPSIPSHFVARDAIGVCPLYYGVGEDKSIWFSSEVKCLIDHCVTVNEFPPGYCWSSEKAFFRWYQPVWYKEIVPHEQLDFIKLRHLLEKSVEKRLMTDAPFGVLLSGGLDSSIIASLVCKIYNTRDFSKRKIHSFAVGLKDSPDLKSARQVADFLGTNHHEIHFTIEQGIEALNKVIYHIESFDVTTIRASVPMYLLAKYIKSLGVKVVLSGEGSDEIFGGYLYFHKAPNSESFYLETCRKIKLLSRYDCLRANKSTAAWGVEIRVPFLDKEFLEYVMSIDPEHKMVKDRPEGRIEKWILRKAFDDGKNSYLPKSILWRQKEQFSDGVGYSWINSLKEYADKVVTNEEMSEANLKYPINSPTTKEAYYYRSIFSKYFNHPSAPSLLPGGPSIACSTPLAIEWDARWKNFADPSGRAIQVHNSYM